MQCVIACLIATLLASGSLLDEIEKVQWLEGAWVSEADGRWTEERWTPPRGGAMLGTVLNGRGGQADDYEFMHLAPGEDGALTLHVSVNGAPKVGFRLVSATAAEAVFENPKNDYPTRILYRRNGKVLTATIFGRNGTKAQSWHYRRR